MTPWTRVVFVTAVGDGKDKLTYRDAGVDIDKADALVDRITKLAARTRIPGVLSGVGGFAAAFSLRGSAITRAMEDPVLVTGTDGVGTKLKLAFRTGIHDTVGIDLVAMSVNDVVTTGAVPLLFLDYFATGRLELGVAEAVIAGVARGCEIAGCALVGGETAELPGFYADGEYDLAGFAIGVIDKKDMITGQSVRPGDKILGVRSRGLHSNGFSLAQRALFDKGKLPLDARLDGLALPLAEELLTPTAIYAKVVQSLMAALPIKALAHITGGGLEGNLPRVLPDGVAAVLSRSAWTVPPLFMHIASIGDVDIEEMFRSFNMGIGLCVVVGPEDTTRALEVLGQAGEEAVVIGEIALASTTGSATFLWR